MCDETTERELDERLAKRALTRRHFAAGSTAALVAGGLASQAFAIPRFDPAKLIEEQAAVPTPDGEIDGLFIRPKEGKHPGVIIWPDIHGVRPSFFDMARSLASSGYAVMAANPYYRTHKGRLFGDGEAIRSPGGWDRVKPHRAPLSPETVGTDAIAVCDVMERSSHVDMQRGVGTAGFCMTGSWTLRAAAAVPDRIKAAASFHGGGLVTDADDSPHRLAPKIKGGVLIAIAEDDHERQPEAEGVLIKAFAEANVPAEIEVYEGAMHGWVPTDSRAYDKKQSDKAWGRMLALFKEQLA
ncbi:MAG: dienelactone hydrolase family protein [Parvularculaceae bacterium]|nr:dienelactone hydrolase family protein [Parvularculaceae bacterium]